MAAKKGRSRRKATTRRTASTRAARKRKSKARKRTGTAGRRRATASRRKTGRRTRKTVARRKPRARKKAPARSKARTGTKTARRKPAARKKTASRGTTRKKKAAASPSSGRPSGAPKGARRASKASAGAGRSGRGKPPVLDRERRRLPETEREADMRAAPDERLVRSARAGHDELRVRLGQHTATGPRLTGGDVDADWEDAYAVGDEAPGGDNPTPDQDRVDEIGRALGVTYQDAQELKGGDEITDRDRHRWEYDPASSEDWPHDKKEKT